jgi:DNA (cytosine-5)-methyltransferase 1
MLDLAVHQVLDAQPAWFVENDPAASRVPAHHWPDVPNYGDITTVDWAGVAPIHVLTGGFPCTDVSSAGKRAGLRPGTRSGLWSQMVYAISQLRPELVVIENVRGLLSADAHCDLEPCPWCLGDDEGRPLRALGAVLGDLAELGYDARWCGLRASDVGAPHGRFRVFITAWPACDADGLDCEGWPSAGLQGQAGSAVGPTADTESIRSFRAGGSRRWWSGSADHSESVTDPEGDGRREGRSGSAGFVGGSDAAQRGDEPDELCPTCGDPGHVHDEGGFCAYCGSCTDPFWGRPSDVIADADLAGRWPGSGLGGSPGPTVVGDGASTATHSDRDAVRKQSKPLAGSNGATLTGGRGTATTDADRDGLPGGKERHGRAIEPGQSASLRSDPAGCVLDWGTYEPAIRHWERILDRPAPAPTQVGKRGGQQLSPAFTEWLMDWPQGWVTAVPGLSRNDQLKICGNGVVPHQAAAALQWLLTASRERAA